MIRSIAMLLAAAALTACGKTDPAPAAPDLPASSPASAPAEAASTALQPAEMQPAAPQSTPAQQMLVQQLSAVWRPTDEQLLLTISPDPQTGEVDILLANAYLHATVDHVDTRNGIVSMQVDFNGKPVTWSFRRVIENDLYHFRVTMHTGAESELSFVRQLANSDQVKLAELAEQDRINRNAAQSELHAAAPDAKAQ